MSHQICPHCSCAFESDDAPNVQTFKQAGPILQIDAGNERIEKAHARYNELTGGKLPLMDNGRRCWFDYFKAGFTEKDFERVFKFVRWRINNQKMPLESLKLWNLIEPEKFGNNLNMAHTETKKPSQSAVEPEFHTIKPKTPEEQAASQRALESLRQFRRETL